MIGYQALFFIIWPTVDEIIFRPAFRKPERSLKSVDSPPATRRTGSRVGATPMHTSRIGLRRSASPIETPPEVTSTSHFWRASSTAPLSVRRNTVQGRERDSEGWRGFELWTPNKRPSPPCLARPTFSTTLLRSTRPAGLYRPQITMARQRNVPNAFPQRSSDPAGGQELQNRTLYHIRPRLQEILAVQPHDTLAESCSGPKE